MHIETLPQPRRGLRLAALVDVVFLLLVFFMLVSRLDVPQTITVEPPAKSGSGALQGSVLIRLGPDGSLDLNGRAFTISDLPTMIEPFLDKDPHTRFLVQSAFEAPLQDLVHILDGLRTAGADNLTLLEPGSGN
jgi:biopolymer transport protein ExbD